MAEDQVSDPTEVRSQRGASRSQPTMSVHVPSQSALADAAPRLPPKHGLNGQDEISALKLAVPIVRRWPVIFGSAAVVGGLAVALTFVLPARYTARTSFTVEAGSNSLSLPKGLGAIAGQLGVVLGSTSTGPPPAEYFTALATSRTIREALLASRYSGGKLTASGSGTPLLDLLQVGDDTPARRMDEGVRRLRRMIGTDIDRKAGLVTLSIVDRDPERAAAIGNRLIELLNKYNVEQRQTRSRQERELAQKSLAEAQRELRAAEERLQDFLSRNRRYQQSPLLLFEENRLQRAVVQKQELTTGLAQAYEEARIAEVGDIPVISLVDGAVPPARRSFPVRWQFLLGGLFLGGLIGLALVYLLEARRTWIAEQQPDFLALRDAARAWKSRLRGRHVARS